MAITFNGRKLGRAHDISIPVAFTEESMAEFGAYPASKTPFKHKNFVGDVKLGGSCNCDMITFSPHLHGTHTECVGHITAEKVYVHEVLKDPLMPARLVTVAPQMAKDSKESYVPELRAGDRLITKASLASVIASVAKQSSLDCFVADAPRNDEYKSMALIIRTGWKPGGAPPFFSIEAMRYINELGAQHLLVDMPSIDRMDDEGKLTAHRIFWGIQKGHHIEAVASSKTVTELIRMPDALKDGNYILNLQVAAFAADAAPSRPLLYEIET